VVLFTHVTTRIPGEKYADLLREKGGRGFPYLVYMDSEGEVVGQPSGRTVAEFQAGARDVQTYLDLRGKDGLSTADQVRLLVAEISLGKLELAAAESRRDGIADLTAEQKADIDGYLTDLRVMNLVQTRQPRDEASAAEVGKVVYEEMFKKGLTPRGQGYQPYYILLMRYGESAKDVEAFKAGLEGMKARFAGVPQMKRFFDQAEESLKRLQQ